MRGLVRSEAYIDKGQGDGKRRKRVRILNDSREQKTIKLKLFISSAILITTIFIFTGIIVYLNISPRKGCINVHIIPYMPSSLNHMIYSEDINDHDLDESFNYVMNELGNSESRRFTITEIYPFWKWWKNQTDPIKLSVRSLINDGRIEIAGGGWCIPDEAVVHYRTFIDQFTWGLRCLEEIAGKQVSPNVSFLMDNQGHSKEIAFLLKEMGFRGIMLGGISPMEQCYRKTFLQMEFLWSDEDIFGVTHGKPNIFTSILDDKSLRINDYFYCENPNIDPKEFFHRVITQSHGYTTNHIFIPVGGNFQFNKMKNIFNVIESIIKLMKTTPRYKLNVDYSTPSIYLNSIDYDNKYWIKSKGEFLPYFQGKNNYWTGYYSIKPSFKYVQRVTDRFLQIFKQLITISDSEKEFKNILTNLRESVGLSLHHDLATSCQNIAQKFHDLLIKSMEEAQDGISLMLEKLMVKRKDKSKLHYESCLKLNISECSMTERNSSFIVTVYNPSSQIISKYIRFPVTGNDYQVKTGDGQSLKTQIVKISNRIRSIPGRESQSEKELIFRATNIPALGFKSFYISKGITKTVTNPGNKDLNLVFNELTGKLSEISRRGENYSISQELKFYMSWFPSQVAFSPFNGPKSISKKMKVKLLNDGELMTEYEQIIDSWTSQMMRIYKDEDFVECNWILGSIPMSVFQSKEIVSSFSTNLQNGFSFYLDTNGRGFQRNFNSPNIEDEDIMEKIARNYNPINSRIAIADHNYQLHIFTDRIQGGSAPFQGQIEIMLNRKFSDMALLGKPESSNEISENFEIGQHWIFIGSSKDTNFKSSINDFSATVGWEPWLFFANAANISYEEWRENYLTEFTGLKSQLPKNIRILTLEPWSKDQILLRMENFGHDKVIINLQDLFSNFFVKNATQVSLTGNNLKETFFKDSRIDLNQRMKNNHENEIGDLSILVYPSQIKTFILAVESSHITSY